MSTENPGSEENLCDGLELHSPWMRDFLDPVPGSGGDAGEDQRFSSEGFHLVSIPVHLLGFGIAWGRMLFIGLVFCAMVLQLLLFSWRALSSWALRNH
jgi:hypothetical protein